MADAPWLAENLAALAALHGSTPEVAGDGVWHAFTAGDAAVLELRTAAGTRVAAHSRRNPEAEAGRLVDEALGGRPCPAFGLVIGAGLGYVVAHLLTRAPAMRVVVIEPDPSGVAAFLGHRDWRPAIAARRLLVLGGPAFRGAEHAWRLADVAAAPLVVVHPVLAREHPDEVRRAAAVATRIVADARANAGAEATLAGPYLLNTIANLGVVAREADVGALAGAFAGVPAILAAAGPSLDRVVGEIRRLQDRALVIAVDTALRPLLAHGVRPQLVVAVDPSERNGRHLLGLDGDEATWLVAEPAVHPPVFDGFASRTFAFRVGDNHPWPWLAARGVTRGTLDAWGSVLVSALDLAVLVGARPIAVVGADLAYTGGQPYARGTSFEADWAHEVFYGGRLADVWGRVVARAGAQEQPDLHGRPTPTLPHLVAFRDRLLERIAASGARIVNATGAGLLHGPGLEQSTLAALFDGSPPIADPSGRLRAIHDASVRQRRDERRGLASALTSSEVAAQLAGLVAGVEVERVREAVAMALETMTSPTPAPRPAPAVRRDVPPVWLPEQVAALHALTTPDAATRAPFEVSPGTAPLSAVIDAAAGLVAHAAFVGGPADPEALAASLRVQPIRLAAPIPAAARADADRFGAAFARWLVATADRGPTALPAEPPDPFWTHKPAVIDPPDEIPVVPRARDARAAIGDLIVWAASARGAVSPAVSRLGGALVRPRVLQEAPRAGRVRVAFTAGDAELPWIEDLALAPLARVLAGTIVRADGRPATDTTQPDRLAVAIALELDGPDGWTSAGRGTVGDLPRLFWMECGRCLSAAALADGRTVVTRQDMAASYLIDRNGAMQAAPSWPVPVFGEGPLDDGTWFAWSIREPRLLVRQPDGVVSHDVVLPFAPIGATPEADGVRFTAADGVWRWTPSAGVTQAVEAPPVVAAWPIGDGYDLAFSPPAGPRRRSRRLARWSARHGLIEHDAPPLGPCWSRSTHAGWTADAFVDAGLIRVSDAAGVRGWVLFDYPRTVAWAGDALVVVTTGGAVALVAGVRGRLA